MGRYTCRKTQLCKPINVKDAIYGIGENRGAWVIQLISEELPGYFKATYLDEKTADGKADNKAIHDWLMKEMAAQAK